MISMDGILEFFILIVRNYKDCQESINPLPTKTLEKTVLALKSFITTSLGFRRIMITV
jgi:hypothetical protein